MPPDRHFSRAKAGNACVACRSAKQRCDGGGQAEVQCRRCEIYGLDCYYQNPNADGSDIDKKARPARPRDAPDPSTATAQVAPAAALASSSSSSSQFHPSHQHQHNPIASTSTSTTTHTSTPASAMGPKPHAHNPISDRLDEINGRLARIESHIGSANTAALLVGASPGVSSDSGHPDSKPTSTKSRILDSRGMDAMAPIKMIGQVVHRQEGHAGSDLNYPGGQPNGSSAAGGNSGMGAVYRQKDCIDLGIVSEAQAAALFDFYMMYMNPWNCLVDSSLSPALVRHSNPMLFIAMLVCAGYYCLPVETEAGAVTLAQLTDIYYRNLGSLNVAPSPADLNELTATALLIGYLWKPLRFIDQDLSNGITEACQQKGKFNLDSSYLLWPMLHKMVSAASLQDAPMEYASNASNPGVTHRTRIFFYFVWVETIVALVQGRNMMVNPTDASNVTRLFASRAETPPDFALAAAMDMCLNVYNWQRASEGDRAQQLRALQTFLSDYHRWNSYWHPLVLERERTNRLSLLETMVRFTKLCACSITFQRLTTDKKGAEPLRGALDADERKILQQANDTAHEIMFSFSAENRQGPIDQVWFPDSSGSMPDLNIDSDKLAATKFAPDNAFAIVAFSAPMLLVGWINQKLITSNGEVCDSDEKAETCFMVNRKTWRLLDFMARVLAYVAPKPGHPAAKQSRILAELIQLAHRTSFPSNAPSMGPSTPTTSSPYQHHQQLVGSGNGMHASMTIPASMDMPSVSPMSYAPPPPHMMNPTESVDWNALFKDEFVPPSWQEMGGVQFPFTSM